MKKRRVKGGTKPGHGKSHGPHRKLKDMADLQADCGSSDFGDSDVNSDDFYRDEIDDFHASREKILLGNDRGFTASIRSGEEEVLPITDDELEEEEDEQEEDEQEEGSEFENDEDQPSVRKSDVESDLEDKSDDDLPNLDAWGKKRSTYYNADFVDRDWGKSYREEDKEQATAEEMGAMEMLTNFGVNDMISDIFDIGVYKKAEKDLGSDEEDSSTVVKDRHAISKEDQVKFLEKNSPELFLLEEDFKKLMKELTECILPLVKNVKDDQIQGSAATYIKLKYHLIIHYCMKIVFYGTLKSQQVQAKYHPVMKITSSDKKVLNQLEPLDEKLKHEIDVMLEKLKNGKEIEFNTEQPQESEAEDTPIDRYAELKLPTLKRLIAEQTSDVSRKSKKRKVSDLIETETEKEVTSLYNDMKKQRNTKLVPDSEDYDEHQMEEEEDYEEYNELENGEAVDEKRAVTYEMAKNKGLTAQRNKKYRNPRVRNRMKYRRAKIRRKGQVREPRKELTRYGGELTGIRTDVVKSIKIK